MGQTIGTGKRLDEVENEIGPVFGERLFDNLQVKGACQPPRLMAERLQRLLDGCNLDQHVAVGSRIGVGDGVVENSDFHLGRNRRALDRLASSTRGAALSTIRRINSK